MVKVRQGDIYWVKFGPSKDSGPSGKRPAVVVQNDLLNKSKIQTTVVALITSNRKLAQVPGNILLKKETVNLSKTSVVVVSQMATVDKGRLLEKIGTLGHKPQTEVIEGCRWVINDGRF
jgi:mRNA interferase MazF